MIALAAQDRKFCRIERRTSSFIGRIRPVRAAVDVAASFDDRIATVTHGRFRMSCLDGHFMSLSTI